MLNEYHFDGKIHALSDKHAYVLEEVAYDKFYDLTIDEIKPEFVKEFKDKFFAEYADYLLKVDQKKVRELLIKILSLLKEEHIQYVVRPPWIVSCLAQQGTICAKFERSPNDHHYFVDQQKGVS